ncbi:PAS domain-containing protein, partial [Proteus mirabilis]|uniref:PAS domain-containing protein n=1 Tax=Proteus mirabilis TaxID=584 RepID=UPI00195409EA
CLRSSIALAMGSGMDLRTPVTPLLAPAPALLRAVLDASAEAVLLCRASDDTILLANAAALE